MIVKLNYNFKENDTEKIEKYLVKISKDFRRIKKRPKKKKLIFLGHKH